MSDYKIITDSGCDLPQQMLSQLDVLCVPLMVTIHGKDMEDSVDAGIKQMYADLRAGEVAKTSAINPDSWAKMMEKVLEQGRDVLTLTFSSGLSTTYQSAVIAAGELQEKYPQRKIRVVDSMAASLGQGLLLHYTCKMRDAGMKLDELADWIEENRQNLCMWFTVDDLMYLKRGGRVSAATALVGTMLQIKPVLHVDEEGRLVSVAKARGRKASIQALVEKAVTLGEGFENEVMYICHGDCLEDARYLEGQLKEKCGVKTVFIGYTGAVIGSHSGPGTLALFFMGKHR